MRQELHCGMFLCNHRVHKSQQITDGYFIEIFRNMTFQAVFTNLTDTHIYAVRT